MKVLLVIRGIGREGAGKMALSLMNALAEKNYGIAVLNYNQSEAIEDLHKNIKHYYGKKNNRILEYFYAINRISSVTKDFKPDIIVAFRDNAAGLAILSNKLHHLDVPIVVCERTDPYMETNFLLRISRKLFKFSAGGVFQTQGAWEFYKDLVKNYMVIPNPVMPVGVECLKKFDERTNEIINVARLDLKQKRQDILLKAFEIVVNKYPFMRLSFLGKGGDLNQLKQLTRNLGIEKNVSFCGSVNDVPKRLINSKMFVLSSDYEGISNALIEAMSVGLPCISTDTSPGGARVLIDDGINGFIVPCSDYEALANRIIYYIEHPLVADSHGQKAKEIVDRYAPDIIFSMWEHFLLDTINKYHK